MGTYGGTRVGVYVDAFNVYYGGRALAGRGTPGWRWLDLAGLARSLISTGAWPDPRITRVAYCTAKRTRVGNPSSAADQQVYIDALLHHIPQLDVIYGYYARRTKTGALMSGSLGAVAVPSPGQQHLPEWLPVSEVTGPEGQRLLRAWVGTFEEKGTDVNVATALLEDVLRGRVDAAMVLSNDADLRYPLQLARAHVPVATVNPGTRRTSHGLRGDPDDGVGRHWWRKLQVGDLTANQLPVQVGPYQRPSGW